MQQEKDTTETSQVIIQEEGTQQNATNEVKDDNYRFASDMDKELHDEVVGLLSKFGFSRVALIRKVFRNVKNGGEAYLKKFMFEEVPDVSSMSSQLTKSDYDRQTNNPSIQD